MPIRNRAQGNYYISQINCRPVYTAWPCDRFALGKVTTATLVRASNPPSVDPLTSHQPALFAKQLDGWQSRNDNDGGRPTKQDIQAKLRENKPTNQDGIVIRRKEMNGRFQLNRRLRREGYKGRQIGQRRATKAQKAVNAMAMPLR